MDSPPAGRVLGVAAVAIVCIVAVNIAIGFVAYALGVPRTFMSAGPGPVTFFTLIGCGLGVAVFFAVRRFAPYPRTTWRMVAYGALLLSFIPDWMLYQNRLPFPGPLNGVVALVIMHIVAGVTLTEVLARMAPEKR